MIQICYRVSDLSFLLRRDGSDLNRYCKDLRHIPAGQDIDDVASLFEEFDDEEDETDDQTEE